MFDWLQPLPIPTVSPSPQVTAPAGSVRAAAFFRHRLNPPALPADNLNVARRYAGFPSRTAERPALAGAPALKALRAGLTEPAPVAEVMREQFNFLLAHGSGDCAPSCPDCARLGAVRELLFKAFR